MEFQLILTKKAKDQLEALEKDSSLVKRFKAVKKSLRLLSANPKHPSLNTHEFHSLSRELGVKVFEAYAENKTPRAYRIFWHYGQTRNQIIILSIIPHG